MLHPRYSARLNRREQELRQDFEHRADLQQKTHERDRLNWWHSRPLKRNRTLTDTTTGMTSTRKRVMGYAAPGTVNAHLGPAEAAVAQREQDLQQAHAQTRAAVTQKLQDMSDIEQWGHERYGADRFPWSGF